MRKSIDKISTLVLRFVPAFLAFFIPLFFLNVTSDPFNINKQYLLFVVAGISLLAWCAKNLARGKLVIAGSPALLPLFLLALVAVASTFWTSPSPYVNFFGTTSVLISLFVIFLTVTSTQKKEVTITSTIYALIASATILSIVSMIGIANIGKYLGGSLWTKAFTPSGNLPAFLSFTIPVMIATIAFAIFGTKRNRFIFLPLAAIMAVGVAINLFLMSPAGATGFTNLPFIYGWSITTDNLKNWRTALIGSGPETYLTVFQQFRPAALNQDPDLWNKVFFSSTNYILTLLNTLGILGLVALLVALIRTIYLGLSDIKDSTNTPKGIFSLTAMISVLIMFFLLPTNIVGITLAIITLLLYTLENKINGNKKVKDYLVNLSAKRFIQNSITDTKENMVLPIITAIFSVVSLYYFWSFAGNIYRAAYVSQMAATKASQGDVNSAYQLMAQAYRLDIRNPDYHSIFSQSSMAILQSYANKTITNNDRQQMAALASQAIREGRTAIALNPAQSTYWENMADIYSQLLSNEGFTDSAIAFYSQAVNLNPNDPTLKVKLGNFYYLIKDYDQAINFYNQADALKPNWSVVQYNLGMAYLAKGDSTKARVYLNYVLSTNAENSEDYQKAKTVLETNLVSTPIASSSAIPKAPAKPTPKPKVTPTK